MAAGHFRRGLTWALLGGLALGPAAQGQRRSALAPLPDWNELERYQETITRAEFLRRLETIYAPRQAAAGLIEVGEQAALIRENLVPGDVRTLRFAPAGTPPRRVARFWRPIRDLGTAPSTRPLQGARIVLDAGHLGGPWAKMEERWFQVGPGTIPVTEGDLTLRVAHWLAPQLHALGAEVTILRPDGRPLTSARPESLREVARAELALEGKGNPVETYAGSDDPRRGESVQFRSELLFFRNAEIRQRAEVVNRELQPDLVVCLHFDADGWGSPEAPGFTPYNRLHALMNGTYSAGELRQDDVRHDMLLKLLEGTAPEEISANQRVVEAMARRMALPPYIYSSSAARRPTTSPYLWARNLLANRLYRCPVIFLEPYAMNSAEVWARVQAGDYAGEQEVAGRRCPSLIREYADAVAEGLEQWFRAERRGSAVGP